MMSGNLRVLAAVFVSKNILVVVCFLKTRCSYFHGSASVVVLAAFHSVCIYNPGFLSVKLSSVLVLEGPLLF